MSFHAVITALAQRSTGLFRSAAIMCHVLAHKLSEHVRCRNVFVSASVHELVTQLTLNPDPKPNVFHNASVHGGYTPE